MGDNIENLKRHIEFESKYRVEAEARIYIKRAIEGMGVIEKFVYVEGPDEYYINKNGDFLRYRRPTFGEDRRSELTMKKKMESAKNNIIREEWNVRVDETPAETIREMIKNLGFIHNFTVWKACDIYRFKDATVVFYTVADITDEKIKKVDNFVEIEVNEDSIHTMTEEEAWKILEKYESALSEIGISAQKRLRKSLYEMYKREA